MKHRIFIYDLLMRGGCPEEGGLKDNDYIGTGCLYGYKREGVYWIIKTDNPTAMTIGDIYEVDDETYNKVSSYYSRFGYHPITENIPTLKDLDKGTDCECTLFVKEDKKMISKNEMAIFGSSDPFEWLKESFDILNSEFRDLYTKNSDIIHFKTTNIEDFKAEIEQYMKDNPNAKVYASGFIMSTENPENNKSFKIRKE